MGARCRTVAQPRDSNEDESASSVEARQGPLRTTSCQNACRHGLIEFNFASCGRAVDGVSIQEPVLHTRPRIKTKWPSHTLDNPQGDVLSRYLAIKSHLIVDVAVVEARS